MFCPRHLSRIAIGITITFTAQLSIDAPLTSSSLPHLQLGQPASAQSILCTLFRIGCPPPPPPPQTSQPKYVPRNTVPRRTQGTGARGCVNEATENQLSAPILLSAQSNQTTLGHPTFFWQLTDNVSTPIEFALVEPNTPQPVYVQRFPGHAAGLMSLTIPVDKPDLVLGKTYRWSVALICNEARRSSDVITLSIIQRVEAPPELAAALSHAISEFDQAKIYDEYGFWADSMALLEKAKAANPNDQTVLAYWQSMLERTEETQAQSEQP